MYHGRFKGNHYQAGFKWGTLLYQHHKLIMDNHLIIINEERKAFTKKCLSEYQHWYPEILQELQGIADGQKIAFIDLCTFMLSMYCFTFENKCTCLAIAAKDKIIFGRNSDFLVALEHWYMNCIYQLDHVYAFNGNTTAFVQMEDGINEYGLAVGLTFVYPHLRKPGLNAGMLVRYLLEHCQTTAQAIAFLKIVPIASSQTITLADRFGDIAVVECNPVQVVIIKPKADEHFVVTTNDFNSPLMQEYKNPAIDDWRSAERYRNATTALQDQHDEFTIEIVQAVLKGKYGFMCQYDRKTGADTVWSVVYDIKQNLIYRTEGNPSRKAYQLDKRLKFR